MISLLISGFNFFFNYLTFLFLWEAWFWLDEGQSMAFAIDE